ncbi:MAG: hypothetical protein H7Z42_19825, partial [Roseiflexaceae bacterium]|nr:hypothetical protein [Roseiflexaceae bacterium]
MLPRTGADATVLVYNIAAPPYQPCTPTLALAHQRRAAEAAGWVDEARLRGLKRCSTTPEVVMLPFAPLLARLDAAPPTHPLCWQGWLVEPVAGGANNRVFRATRGILCFAKKQTIRDARDRAGREDAALRAIARAG